MPPLCDGHPIASLHEILDDEALARVNDQSAWRNANDEIVGVAAAAIGPATSFAIAGLPMLPVPDGGQTIDARFGDENHAATMSAVPSAGTAKRNILSAPEGHAAIAPFAGLHVDFDAVDEHGGPDLGWREVSSTRTVALHPLMRRRHCDQRDEQRKRGADSFGRTPGNSSTAKVNALYCRSATTGKVRRRGNFRPKRLR